MNAIELRDFLNNFTEENLEDVDIQLEIHISQPDDSKYYGRTKGILKLSGDGLNFDLENKYHFWRDENHPYFVISNRSTVMLEYLEFEE